MNPLCKIFGHRMFFDSCDVCGPSTCKRWRCGHKKSGIEWPRVPTMPNVKPPMGQIPNDFATPRLLTTEQRELLGELYRRYVAHRKNMDKDGFNIVSEIDAHYVLYWAIKNGGLMGMINET